MFSIYSHFYVLAFLERFHCYIIILGSICSYFTSDTYANGHSACAAKLAAGLCADLASLIVSGHVRNGFALVLSDELIYSTFHLIHYDALGYYLSIRFASVLYMMPTLCSCLPEDR